MEKCGFIQFRKFIPLSVLFFSILEINRWHGIEDKINKDEKFTSVTKTVIECQYNHRVNRKIHSHTNKIPPPSVPKTKSQMQQMRNQVYGVVFGDSSSRIPSASYVSLLTPSVSL